ncbi:MAG: glycosyltransferase [Thermoleophilaceae bacterium]
MIEAKPADHAPATVVADGSLRGLRAAYLTSRYPAISHSFIRREVETLRGLGARIDTFGIHRADPEHVLSAADREDDRRTYAVAPPRWRELFGAHARAAISRPRGFLGAVGLALRAPASSARERLRRLIHFAEGVQVWRECERRGIRHVHAHFTSPPADVALLAAEVGGWSWSFTAHGVDISADASPWLAEKVRRAAFVVCVSDHGRAQLMALVEKEHWPKLHLVRCGVDVTAFKPRTPRRRGGARLSVLTVGRAEPVKGQMVLLEALAMLEQHGLDVAATLVGGGSLLSPLRQRARELGVAEQVNFAGNVGHEGVHAHYAAADAFCLPSFGEGVPVVLMEAMASGLPVVASRVGGIQELVEHGLSGFLVPPGRPDLIAAALERLADDPELRAGMGEAGRAIVAAHFDPVVSGNRLAGLFREMLGCDGGGW